jgi:cell division protein ZapA (FtsZ GTPase activity inhibitor)
MIIQGASNVPEIIEVMILGRKFSLKTDGKEEHVRELVKYVNEKLADVQSGSPGLTDMNIAILACLNVADDYFDAMGRQRAIFEQIEHRCDDLLDYIDAKV